jgi:hypothetical protein
MDTAKNHRNFFLAGRCPPPPALANGALCLSTMVNPALHALLDNTHFIDAGCKCDNFVLATCEVHPVDKRDIKKS